MLNSLLGGGCFSGGKAIKVSVFCKFAIDKNGRQTKDISNQIIYLLRLAAEKLNEELPDQNVKATHSQAGQVWFGITTTFLNTNNIFQKHCVARDRSELHTHIKVKFRNCANTDLKISGEFRA